MFKKNELKLLFPFYLHALVFSLSKVIMPFYVLYFLGLGLSFFQIAMLGSIRSIVSLIFEVPTGVIADMYGRKASVILGYFATAVTIFLISTQNSFYAIALILALDALFETLISGADNAWAVDLLDEQDKSLIDVYFLKMRFFKNIGYLFAPILAGFIVAKYDMRYLWIVFSIGIFVSSSFLFWAKEGKLKKPGDEDGEEETLGYFINHLRKSLSFIANHKIISLLFLGIFIFYFVDEISSLAWTPLLESSGIALPTIGYAFSLIAGVGIFTPLIAERILKFRNKLSLIIITLLVYTLLLLLVGLTSKALFLLIIFTLFTGLEDIFLPLEGALTNFYIHNQNRATILSIKSMIESLASIVGGPFAGLVLSSIPKKEALVFSGLLLLFLPVSGQRPIHFGV